MNTCSSAFQRIGIINKVLKFKFKTTTLNLYKSLIRPKLEYCSLLWSPYTTTNIEIIEKVQKRICKLIFKNRTLSYREQLKNLNLLTLKSRRLRYQLILLYKLFHGLVDIDKDSFFTFVTICRTRGTEHKILPPHCTRNYRLNFVTVSIIEHWNRLPDYVIMSPNINQFKKFIKDYFHKYNIW